MSIPLLILLIVILLMLGGSGYGYYNNGTYASPLGLLGALLLILFIAWLIFGGWGTFYGP